LGTILIAALAVACGRQGPKSIPAAELNKVLLDRGYGKRLMAVDVQTCATRELPIIGHEPVAFTRDHKLAASLRRTNPLTATAVPSRLSVGPATQDERDVVWTVGDNAVGGMAFDPSGRRIALGLQRTFDRGGTFAPGAVDDGLWIINASGDDRRHLVTGNPRIFAWSPDGKKIASTKNESSSVGPSSTTVFTVDVASGQQRILATLDQSITTSDVMDWSPDGQKILLLTSTTGPSPGRILTRLEQIGAVDGQRTTLAAPPADVYYERAVYAADGRTVIAQRTHVPSDPPNPLGGPSITIPMDAPNRRTSELGRVRTDGTDDADLHSLCPIDPSDKLLDWH